MKFVKFYLADLIGIEPVTSLNLKLSVYSGMAKKINIDIESLKEKAPNHTIAELAKLFNCGIDLIGKYLKKYSLTHKKISRTHSDETKAIQSKKRKEWLKNNPDKHPWRNKDKFQSKPCDNVKKYLNSLKVPFVEEYDPQISERHFSIDIALPDKMIAIEINGNQHYKSSGELKPYYQERHDLLVNSGWNVFEVHYSACFDLEKWSNFIELITNSPALKYFDYFSYTPKYKVKTTCVDCNKPVAHYSLRCRSCYQKYSNNGRSIRTLTENFPLEERGDIRFHHRTKKTRNLCECGNLKSIEALRCYDCYCISSRKVKNRPPKEELEQLILEYPLTVLGKRYGVSDNSIKKWCLRYEIPIPNNKYRQAKFHQKI